MPPCPNRSIAKREVDETSRLEPAIGGVLGGAWKRVMLLADRTTAGSLMPQRILGWRLGLGLAVLGAACTGPPSPREISRDTAAQSGAECRSRLIVGFAAATNVASVTAVARAADVRLIVVNELLPDLYVLDLVASGGPEVCEAGTERLRANPDVRYVELDSRRGPEA